MIPNTVIVTIIGLTPVQYTGISSASTNMLRIIGGAIGPVITTVIVTSTTIPITVDSVTKSLPRSYYLEYSFCNWGCDGNCKCGYSVHNEAPCNEDEAYNSRGISLKEQYSFPHRTH